MVDIPQRISDQGANGNITSKGSLILESSKD